MNGNQNAVGVDHSTMSPSTRTRSRRGRVARFAIGVGTTVVMAVAAAACGDDDSSADPATSAGEQLSRSSGCAGCHGGDFDGGAGPGWIGLAGSEVQLTDGTTVIADDDYLTTAIVDPSAQLVEGYNLRMPANNLTDAEVAEIVAFINTLADG